MSDTLQEESASEIPDEVNNTTSPQTPQSPTTSISNSLSSELPDVQGLHLTETIEHTNPAVNNINSSSNTHQESNTGEAQLAKADDMPKILTKFTIFPELAEELRIKIWKTTIVPRLVSPFSQPSEYTPAILHVSTESRREALKAYTAIPCNPDHSHPKVFVNFDKDLLSYSYALQRPAPQIAPLRKLVLTSLAARILTFPNPLQVLWSRIQTACPNLSELVLVSCQQRPGSFADLSVVNGSSVDFTQREMERVMAWDAEEKAAGRSRNLKITFMDVKTPDRGV